MGLDINVGVTLPKLVFLLLEISNQLLNEKNNPGHPHNLQN